MERYWRLHRGHYRETLRLGVPVVISQLGQITVGLADSIMIGRLGATELATAAFANTLFSLPLIFGMGFAMSLTPFTGRAWARKDYASIQTLWKNGLLANLLMAFVLLLVAAGLYLAMPLMQQPLHLVAPAQSYFLILASSLLPLMVFFSGKQLLEGLSNTRIAMIITLLGNLLNILGNYLLIYGKAGFPELGLNGAGISTLLARLAMATVMLLLVVRHRALRQGIRAGLYFSRKEVQRLYRLGLPMGLHLFSESSAFIVSGIMMGWLGETALAAHQIVMSLSTLGFMLYQGIGVSSTIRISQLSAHQQPLLLQAAARASIHIVLLMVLLISLFFLIFRVQLPFLFTPEAEVARLATDLILILIIYQLFDALQIIFSGILRGLADARIPGLLTIFSYFGVAIPLSYLSAFHLDLGPAGIWLGFPVGLGVCALLFYFRIRKKLAGS
ncbi:MATE family efflux transporter [Geofilum rhodophaeum]|uniref:MATE family efflux transporter n=1 Tax=Geofilum rhodophaeum TaxID=1965019 RepID=UPI000B5227D5|nr:MATE family efflux transporter [Geofilum rhodophaeum]